MRFAPAIVFLAATVSAQEQRYRFETRIEAVGVDVAVSRDDRPVTGLRAEDFEVRDNGILQEVDRVQVETAPVNAILILDNSESVSGDKLSELRSAARDFIGGLRENDRAALVTFAHHVQLRQDLTADSSLLLGALDELSAFGHTALYDALFAGLMLAEPPLDRPVVVLFSDGLDNISRISESEILDAVRESNAVVYAVRSSPSADELWDSAPKMRVDSVTKRPFGVGVRSYRSQGTVPRVRDRDRFLRRIADQSGGRLFRIDHVSDMRQEFLRVLNEIKSRYLLTYSPRGVANEGWHTLEVKLKNHKGEVRARRGYYLLPSSQRKNFN